MSLMAKKALVVDNDFFFVEFLAQLLEERGYQVIKALDGKEGLAKFKHGPFDILFTDLIMPKIDGAQLIKIARQRFSGSHFSIIAISGAIIERQEDLFSIDADYCLAKAPLEKMEDDLNALLDRLEQHGVSPGEDLRIIEPGSLYPRQATTELIENLNFQKAVTESIGLGVVVVDRDVKIISATSRALEITKKSLDKILNKPVTSLLPKGGRPPLVHALKTVARDPELDRISLMVTLGVKRVRLVVSLLRFMGDVAGWIVAMEEVDE
ncbi:MAG TPA: response regulator [Deltaproteobacteria bacterium]|nr:response regulator [Deltaproteobacteria bacterium]